jgi:hypothetical protein
MERLRARYRRIYFLNGNAGGGVHRPEVLPLVDRFYNKALFRDRSLYTRSLCGAELFTEFNQQTYGITDPQPVLPAPIQPEDTSRLHVTGVLALAISHGGNLRSVLASPWRVPQS